jgi:hypothetical protein
MVPMLRTGVRNAEQQFGSDTSSTLPPASLPPPSFPSRTFPPIPSPTLSPPPPSSQAVRRYPPALQSSPPHLPPPPPPPCRASSAPRAGEDDDNGRPRFRVELFPNPCSLDWLSVPECDTDCAEFGAARMRRSG